MECSSNGTKIQKSNISSQDTWQTTLQEEPINFGKS